MPMSSRSFNVFVCLFFLASMTASAAQADSQPPVNPEIVQPAAREAGVPGRAHESAAGQTVDEKPSTTWDTAREISEEVWEKSKETTRDIWNQTKHTSQEIWDATKQGANKASEYGEKAWDKTKDVSKQAWDKTKGAAAATGHAARQAYENIVGDDEK